jgi:hypothetical protein
MYNMSEPLYPTCLSESALAEQTATFVNSLPPSADNTGKVWSVAQWDSVEPNISEQTAEIIPEANADALSACRGVYTPQIPQLEQDFGSAASALIEIANTLPDGAVISNLVPEMLSTLAVALSEIANGEDASETIDLYSRLVAAYQPLDEYGLWPAFALEQAGLADYQTSAKK